MKEQISKTKILIYLLLTVITIIYARISFDYYLEDTANRTIPQINRAMIQVSGLLPQLQENEEAVRDVYAVLEKSRNLVHKNNVNAINSRSDSTEDAETVINHTVYWMKLVTNLRIGRQGHVIIISKDNHNILVHPDKRFIGEKLIPMGTVDMNLAPDISEIGPEYTTDKLNIFFPASFYKGKISPDHLYAAAEAGIFGTAFAYKDTYILCGISLYEAVFQCLIRALSTTLIFFLISFVFIRYIGFSLDLGKEDIKEFSGRLIVYAVFSVSILFMVTWYYQTIMDVTGDIAAMNDQAQVAAENLKTYGQYSTELSKWLDDQYLEQCRLAADMVNAKGAKNLTRQELDKYATDLEIEYIYVFDRDGKVIVTNSPYDHFKLSSNPEDQSYAFRPLLDGREYVIQAPQKDEMSGVVKQYIGVSLRDENDISDGFVQISVDPELREHLLKPFSVESVLDNMVIGIPEYALAIDKDTMAIVATTGLGYECSDIEDLGIEKDDLKNNYNGLIDVKGTEYYVGVSETKDLFLMPLTQNADIVNSFNISLRLAILSALTVCLFVLMSLKTYKMIRSGNEAEAAYSNEPEKGSKADDGQDSSIRIPEETKVTDIYGFEHRWNRQGKLPAAKQTPVMRTKRLIHNILLFCSASIILYELFEIGTGKTSLRLDGFSYVLLGDWEKGLNLFSITYCIFLICVLHVIQELLNFILYHIAKVSDGRKENVLLLLRNALKYLCALAFLYMGLAKLGIDTRALWASAGVLSLIIGLGAKDLVNDIISGLFIIFEGTYKVGDFIRVGEWGGIVQEIGLRYTKVAYFSETKIFNNSSIRDVTNSDGRMAKEVVKVPIPYETDLLEFEKLINREIPGMAKSIPGMVKMPKYRGVYAFEDRGIILRFVVYSTPVMRKKALRAFQRELKLLFDREHITIPYNHLVVMDYKDENNTYNYHPEEDNELS